MYRLIVITFLVIISSSLRAQEIRGIVRDAESKEEIPFANVWINGTMQGTQSDLDGRFVLKNPKGDTLSVSSVGYKPVEIAWRENKELELQVELQKTVEEIEEVTVKPDVPFARILFNLIQKHKNENQEAVKNHPDYKTIENTTVYIAVDTAKNSNFLLNNLSEVTVDLDNQEMQFSPIYLFDQSNEVRQGQSETVYERKDGIFPRISQAIESQILYNVVVDLDFYRDQIILLDRGFISPLSSTALMYYNIYFNDSIIDANDHLYYKLTYTPKNKFNPLFSGSFVIDSENYALKEIEAYISKEANLNFVNGFKGNVSYKKQRDGSYFYDEQKVGINLSLRLNKDTTKYNSNRFDNVSSGNWLINKSTYYSTSEDLDKIAPENWKQQPQFSVNQRLSDESYAGVTELKEQNLVKGIDKIGGMALTSFFNVGKLDIGPVFDIYSTNRIEGNRLTIPLRTSEQLWKRFSIGGFLGYGMRNKEIKYGANVIYQPGETDRILLRAQYFNDYNLVSRDKFFRFVKNNPNNKGNSNFIATFTTREKNPYIREEEGVELRFEYNTSKDVHFEVNPYFSTVTGNDSVQFTRNGSLYETYQNYGALFDMQIAFGQPYDKFFFDRIYYINPIPVINLGVDVGKVSLPGSANQNFGMYSHFHGSIFGRLLMGQVFYNYMINAGYVMGDAPYDMLDQPVGSMSLGYAKYRFNLLHHASFAHNAYINLHSHFNGGGIILNRIPLLKRLKLREVLSIKAHYGKLTSGYTGVFDLPGYFDNSKNAPYAEIGVGLTNIFKVLRVEYVRQLGGAYKDAGFVDTSGIYFRTEMSF